MLSGVSRCCHRWFGGEIGSAEGPVKGGRRGIYHKSPPTCGLGVFRGRRGRTTMRPPTEREATGAGFTGPRAWRTAAAPTELTRRRSIGRRRVVNHGGFAPTDLGGQKTGTLLRSPPAWWNRPASSTHDATAARRHTSRRRVHDDEAQGDARGRRSERGSTSQLPRRHKGAPSGARDRAEDRRRLQAPVQEVLSRRRGLVRASRLPRRARSDRAASDVLDVRSIRRLRQGGGPPRGPEGSEVLVPAPGPAARRPSHRAPGGGGHERPSRVPMPRAPGRRRRRRRGEGGPIT